ncbi:MAG TPA: hypothetical protein VN442_02060 [Bryobacteraceae bacterium]|nr:hypothetical protein [Bryobacteraceae bacterium]
MTVAEKHQGDGIQPRAVGWRSAARALAVPALLLLIIVLFYWKITLTKQYTWLDAPDFAYQVLPWYQFQASEWHQGRIPLWDPYLWGGQPLIGQAQPGAAYPPNWLLFRLPLRDGKIRRDFLHWFYVLTHYFAALFCYWLCRDLHRSRGASLLAGLGFSLSGWFGSTEWPQMMNGAMWAPLILLFLLRALRGERPFPNAAISGALLGMAFLSGHHQIPIFVALACGGLWIYGLFRGGRLNTGLLAPAAAFGIFLLLVSALQTLPAYEYGKLALRWVGAANPVGWKDAVPYTVHANFGLYPFSILGIVIPGFFRHADPFIGLVLAGFAFIALAAAWRERNVRLFAAVAIGGLIYSLSWHGLFQGIVYALVPVVDKARNASMAVFIFHLGIVVLAAYGLDAYLNEERWTARLVKGLAIFGGFIFAALLFASVSVAQRPMDYDRVALAGFIALLLAGALHGWKHGHITGRTALVLVTMLMLMEAGAAGSSFAWAHRDKPDSLLKKLSQHDDIAAFLKQQPGPVRAEVDANEIPYNFGDWHAIDTVGGYLASLTINIHQVQPHLNARLLMGTNYYVGKTPTRPGQIDLFAGGGGLHVFSNPGAFPRAWSVHQATSVPGWDEVGLRLDRDSPEALRQATFLIGETPALGTCAAPDNVRLLTRAPNRLVIEADMGCRGMVVAGDLAFPGWYASVDGKPARLWDAYGFLRGVVVEGGRHRIEMRYRPRSVVWGATLTALGLLGTILLAIVVRPRWR